MKLPFGLRAYKSRTDYGRGPARWFICRADELDTSVRSIFRNPYKAARFLFTDWRDSSGDAAYAWWEQEMATLRGWA